MEASFYLGRAEQMSSAVDHAFIAREGIEDSLAYSPICDYQFKNKVIFSPYCVPGMEAIDPLTSRRIIDLDAICRGNLICRNCLRIIESEELLAKKLLQAKLDKTL